MKNQNSQPDSTGLLWTGVCCALLLLSSGHLQAAERRSLNTHVADVTSKLPLIAPLPATNRLQLAIGLPLHNEPALTNLLGQLYDHRSTNFHRWLTPGQFTDQFGPTEQDYQRVKDFATSNRLEVVGTYGNRAVLDVAGSVADIQNTFRVHLGVYQHPTEHRQFFAPDVEPTVDAGLPISYVAGLDNYAIPHPNVRRMTQDFTIPQPGDLNGSGTNGNYIGKDFRNAYVPGVSSKGEGQVVGLVEYAGFTTNDVLEYESLAGLPNVKLQTIVLPGGISQPISNDTNNLSNIEVALDIDMVVAMVPDATEVLIVEGSTGEDAMNQLASTNNGAPLPNQASSSWTPTFNTNCISALLEMAVQGQSFFNCSFDAGAPSNGIQSSATSENYMTLVGGTILTLTNHNTSTNWASEIAWPSSTGYIETDLPIPEYQKAINTTANGGSPSVRNIPDVAACAQSIEIVFTLWQTNGTFVTGQIIGGVGGTSAASPLWAAFTALVNEQAAAQGSPNVGFLNPALYAIAQGPSYNTCFHDITVGNNSNTFSANLYFAGSGYDNVTGLGTPNGSNLINALLGYTGPVFVDFNYHGSPMNGSFFSPFNTLAQGTNAVSPGGPIFIINGGSSPETMTITKPMFITVQNGAATIGKQ